MSASEEGTPAAETILVEDTPSAVLIEEVEAVPAEELPSWAEGPDFDWAAQFMKMMITLSFILISLVALGWVLKRVLKTRMDVANATSEIKILERRIVSPKSSIYLIKVRHKEIVIAESAAGIQSLAVFGSEDISSEESSSQSS